MVFIYFYIKFFTIHFPSCSMISNLSHLNEDGHEDEDDDEDSDGCYESELLDSYLAEIALDSN